MTISRRDFLLAGSALSTLWLTGCGGGASAGGQPTATTAAAVGSCIATSVTNATAGHGDYAVTFSNTTAFAHADIPLMLVSAVGERFMGCTNQIVIGVESPDQELTLCFVQTLTDAQTCNGNIVRALRLHLSIPHDASSTTLLLGDTFTWAADSANPTGGQKLFSGELIVTDPQADDGNNCAAYQITGGTLVLDELGLGTATLRLTNVTATAAAAGSGNNAAYASGGQVQMDGTLGLMFESLSLIPIAA
ncbi:hypothetical protein [Aquabacterium sp.]|uniref:hypothetical protein n=1 Tax=Aquabacterium sp. TaxID=1872578 RepID=UPI0035B10B88